MDKDEKKLMRRGLRSVAKKNDGKMSEKVISSYLVTEAGMNAKDARQRAKLVMDMIRLANTNWLAMQTPRSTTATKSRSFHLTQLSSSRTVTNNKLRSQLSQQTIDENETPDIGYINCNNTSNGDDNIDADDQDSGTTPNRTTGGCCIVL